MPAHEMSDNIGPPVRVDKDDPELVQIAMRCDEARRRLCDLHAELQNPMDESRKVELRKQYREAAAEHGQASDNYRQFHYARGDYSIPKPE